MQINKPRTHLSRKRLTALLITKLEFGTGMERRVRLFLRRLAGNRILPPDSGEHGSLIVSSAMPIAWGPRNGVLIAAMAWEGGR